MDKHPKRVVKTTTVIRFEMQAPVDMKHWGFLFSIFLADFERAKRRKPEFDNDWWIEPMDDGIAICYLDEVSE